MTTGSTPQSTTAENLPDQANQGYLVRSEEQLHVRTDQEVAGYARLEKFTVTETKTITVEVTHEEVRLLQSAADTTRQAGPVSPAGGDSARWMVLSGEEVVVTKRVVPMERVRLEVYPVVEQREITEQVRKEQIDTAPEIVAAAPLDGGPPR